MTRAGAQHGRGLRRARRPRPPARRADRQRRTHLPRGRRRRARRSPRRSGRCRRSSTTRRWRSKELDKFAERRQPLPRRIPPGRAPAVGAARRPPKPFAPQFNSFLTALGPLTKAAKMGLPEVATTLDLTVPMLENLRPGAAQLRSVPAVHGRVRARAAGVLRQPHGRHPGQHERQRAAPAEPGPQAALPAHDAGVQPGKPRDLLLSGSAPTAPTPTSSPAPSARSATAACRCSAPAPAPTRRRR